MTTPDTPEVQQLVNAAGAVLSDEGLTVAPIGRVVAAVLRKLSELQRPGWENDVDWPDPDDLDLLANEAETASYQP